MEDIVAVAAAISDLGGILYGGRPLRSDARTPSYPNWQRKRIQNPSSVSSSLTEGTQHNPTARDGRPVAVFAQTCCGPHM
jgi:hypothetical protein